MRLVRRLCPLLVALSSYACAQGAPPMDRPGADAGGTSRDASAPLDAAPVEADAEAPFDAAGCTPMPERCNGRDDDCDGRIDEDATDGARYHRDLDGDGWGSDTNTIVACSRPDGALDRGGDCDDGSHVVYPESRETCDGLDNDCSGTIDDVPCPAGCRGVAFGGHGYMFCSTRVAWSAARDACIAAGMRMVRVDTSAENEFLYATASAAGGIGDHFLGGRVEGDGSGRWRWADGADFWAGVLGGSAVEGRYTGWESDKPDSNTAPRCTVARSREMGRWYDASCDTAQAYVCERY